MTHPAAYDAGLILTSRTEHRGYVIAALSGELGLAAAPALREQLLNLVRPAASQLIIDLSGVRSADTSGLAVLIGSGRRATLLGGFLRLAAPSMAVAGVLAATGMDEHLDVFPSAAPGSRLISVPCSPNYTRRKKLASSFRKLVSYQDGELDLPHQPCPGSPVHCR